MKIPKNLAAVADLYFTTRAKRLAMEKEAAKVQEQETLLREHLINNLPKSQIGGIAGKLARVEVVTKQVPKIEDRELFEKFRKQKGNEDLVNVALNTKAVKERWDVGKGVPGVGAFTVVSLSLHSLTSKGK